MSVPRIRRSRSINEIVDLNNQLQEAGALFTQSNEGKEKLDGLINEIGKKMETYVDKHRNLGLLPRILYPNDMSKQASCARWVTSYVANSIIGLSRENCWLTGRAEFKMEENALALSKKC
ncbi:MAG: hypothetical protein V4489_08750 [Chlamydiota bacterium]